MTRASQPPIRVRHLPSSPRWREKIIYISKLTEELENQGIQVDYAADKNGDYLTRDLLNMSINRRPDILHFHWTAYQYEGGSTISTFLSLMKFMAKVGRAKAKGFKIVWTMHNYLPHEGHAVWVHYLERFWMARQADAIIVHASQGKELLARRFFRTKDVYVIPHGNYIPFFTRTPPLAAKQLLGIENHRPLLLYFGFIRPYKGVPELLRAFKELPDLNMDVHVVGNAGEAASQEINALATHDPRIHAKLKYVPDEELALYLCAADAVILPYRDILGSGALVTALSLGCPVIAPSIGAFAELLDESCGYLYKPGTDGLKKALLQIPNLDLVRMSVHALEHAKRYPWQGMVRQIANIYNNIACEHDFDTWVNNID